MTDRQPPVARTPFDAATARIVGTDAPPAPSEPPIEPPARHYVDRDRVECLGYVCGECGDDVDGDGDAFWHRNPDLEPNVEMLDDD